MLQYTALITPHKGYKCNCNCSTLITLHYNCNFQLQLHYITTLHRTTSSSCGEVTTATIATTPKKNNANHLSVHQWIRSAIRDWQQPTSPIGFLFLKLPPPPWAVLFVYIDVFIYIYNIYTYKNMFFVYLDLDLNLYDFRKWFTC